MTKRFTDNEIWSKDWFLELSIKQKLLLKFLFDNCDCAGFYEISYRTLKNCFGEEITKDDFKNLKQVFFINENTVYIQDFIKFQYGCEISELNPNYSVHKGIIKKINKYNAFETLTEGLANSYNVELQDKDKDKDKDNITYISVKEKENLTKEKESLENWHGEYSNVHLTAIQYAKLNQYVGKKEVAQELIEELSANIASKRDKSPPYDENYPDMHLVALKKYWDYRRKGEKIKTYSEKQNDFTAQIEALAQKYRIEEEREGVRSG